MAETRSNFIHDLSDLYTLVVLLKEENTCRSGSYIMAAPLYTDCDSQSHMYAHMSHAHAACRGREPIRDSQQARSRSRLHDRGSAFHVFTGLCADSALLTHTASTFVTNPGTSHHHAPQMKSRLSTSRSKCSRGALALHSGHAQITLDSPNTGEPAGKSKAFSSGP